MKRRAISVFQRGFGSHHTELNVVIAIVAILAAIAIPACLQARNTGRDTACVLNLARQSEAPRPELVCPHIDAAYVWSGGAVACPAPDALPTSPRVEGGRWSQELPLAPTGEGPLELAGDESLLFATRTPDGALKVERRASAWRRYLGAPLLLLLAFLIVAAGGGDHWENARTKGEWKPLAGVAAGCLLPIVLVFSGGLYMLTREETVVFEPGGTIRVQAAHYGVVHGGEEPLTPLAVVPVRGQSALTVGAVVRDERELEFVHLFNVSRAQVGVIRGVAAVGSVVAPTTRGE